MGIGIAVRDCGDRCNPPKSAHPAPPTPPKPSGTPDQVRGDGRVGVVLRLSLGLARRKGGPLNRTGIVAGSNA